MQRQRFRIVAAILLAVSVMVMGPTQVLGVQGTDGGGSPGETPQSVLEARLEKAKEGQSLKRITSAERQGAAARKQLLMGLAAIGSDSFSAAALVAPPGPGGIPDYFGEDPNWAYSPELRKFVDTLPGVGPDSANNLGQYISVAVPDTTTYPGSDYYEIELRQYTEQMHSDLPPTTLRGYVQVNKGTDKVTGENTVDPSPIRYLGPTIIAERDRPVRIKFTNKLPTGQEGDLFIPVDTTVMGAGAGPTGEMYTENRATLHLHGGKSPWISDGTPHQWITPAGEDTPYPKGVSVRNVPDMPDPGDGSQTFFYTNQQSARFMFYHDHSFGITRLNVYAGEAAGYFIQDPVEQDLVNRGIIPSDQIPLIVQDKSFVDAATVRDTDPTWNWGSGAPDANGIRPVNTGDLWWPHVYMPAQNPEDITGVNAMGRWHYGPWFWPPTQNIAQGPVPNPYYDPINAPWEPTMAPGTPDNSMGMESFLDTSMVNGTAYPSLTVDPKAYRFRILNASNDRFFNLQMYTADPSTLSSDGRTDTEVKMVPAQTTPGFPQTWPTDGRAGGVPDPATVGPDWIQIGSESGFLPAPAVVPNQPITWNNNPTTFNAGNVELHSLLLGCAERADVVVDFSAYAGQTLILYNDAPAAFPALDPRYDYYTGNPDLTDEGGHSGTQVGYGPNTRTMMQIKVADKTPEAPFDLAALEAEFVTTATQDGVFKRGQDPIIVGQAAYNSTYNQEFPTRWPEWGYSRIQDNYLSFKTFDGQSIANKVMQPKAIQDEMGEAFDHEFGRMSGNLGVERLGTNAANQNLILYSFSDPSTENLTDAMTPLSSPAADGTQIWKITHNGVDTHPIHFHLSDVQLINRVGWDGMIRLPDANELGWKETVRISPLEDTIVALRPVAPKQPFGMPDSVRPLNPALPIGSTAGFANIDPNTGQAINPPITNQMTNFGWEYVWHCHILSHEEMDMMRPITLSVARMLAEAPVLTANRSAGGVDLEWTDGTPAGDPSTLGNPRNEIGFRIERATLNPGGQPGDYAQVGTALANQTTFQDGTASPNEGYSYRVVAFNAAGDSASAPFVIPSVDGAPNAPSGLSATVVYGPDRVDLAWTDNATTETGFVIERATNGGAFAEIANIGPSNGVGAVSHTDNAVVAGNTYAYRVKAVNGAVASGYTNTATVTVLVTPNAPSGLSAAVQAGPRADLSWTDNANNETGFVVERSTNGGAFAQIAALGANVLSYSDTTVALGTQYSYRVKAVNGPLSSAWSNTASITVPGALTAPSNLRASASRDRGTTDRVTLRWNDNSTGETGFTIQRATNAGFTANVVDLNSGPNTTSFTNSGLPRKTTFYYRIRAYNAGTFSAWSTAVSVNTP